jgi:hypothetical protein
MRTSPGILPLLTCLAGLAFAQESSKGNVVMVIREFFCAGR